MSKDKPNLFKRIKTYLGEIRAELKKVTWPNRDTLVKMSIAVFVASAIFGIYLTLIDLGFRKIIDKIIEAF